MNFYENIDAERERIQNCIRKFGWTSDHNLDWFIDAAIEESAKPVFIQFDDGTGLLTHQYPDKWRIWSDPLSGQDVAVQKISEFSEFILRGDIKEVWCDDVSDKIYPALQKIDELKLNKIYYSLLWPTMNMEKYDPALPGGHFKDIRNAKNKFHREHKLEVINADKLEKNLLHKIVDEWKNIALKKQKEDVYDLKYHRAIDKGFKGFLTSRVILTDGKPVGFNAGYEVPNFSGKFAGVIGIHNYSFNDLGLILWLEDLEWIKNAGYKELDMQGSEDDGGLKIKLRFGAAIERKTDTFSITKK